MTLISTKDAEAVATTAPIYGISVNGLFDAGSSEAGVSAGAVTFAAGYATLDTSATISSGYRLNWEKQSAVFIGDSVMFMTMTRSITGTDYTIWIGAGNITVLAGGITLTIDQMGIKMTRASSGTQTTSATNADGTTETATAIDDGGNGLINFGLIHDDGTDITFYQEGVLKATHTTNMPDETTLDNFMAGVTNLDTATRSTLRIFNFTSGKLIV